ncbi:MAG TPA: RHS repeat-associated core domain-containing protein, partial [Pyrinomonadaceae bacterium]|nr:RHS repeat-associated core domain-containing protein [Pyrinomonadaceae bacterium]
STTGVAYFLTDHLGSASALTDANGNLVEQSVYDSFGNSTGSTRTRYGYTGRERDADTGFLYYRARWDESQVGRFMSEDPIGFESGDNNLYVYVRNSPLRLIDPLGKQVRADARWQPGEVEDSQRLAEHVRSMGSCSRASNTYLCCRNIEMSLLTRIFSQVMGVKHCFLRTGSKEAGMGPVGGGGFPSSPFGGPTEMRDHRGEFNATDCVPICDVDEKCVDQELEIGKSTGKWGLSNNCNTIANDIVKKCKKPCQ